MRSSPWSTCQTTSPVSWWNIPPSYIGNATAAEPCEWEIEFADLGALAVARLEAEFRGVAPSAIAAAHYEGAVEALAEVLARLGADDVR